MVYDYHNSIFDEATTTGKHQREKARSLSLCVCVSGGSLLTFCLEDENDDEQRLCAVAEPHNVTIYQYSAQSSAANCSCLQNLHKNTTNILTHTLKR